MARVILISGKAEHGKTTLGSILKEHFESKGLKVTFTPFASYLKFICKQHFNWNGQKDEQGRTLLQYVGTDVVRKKRPNFWVETTLNFIDTFESEFDVFICDDTRFPSELEIMEYSKHDVLAIRLERKNFENSLNTTQKLHASETALDDYENFDLFVESISGVGNLENAFWNSIEYHPHIGYIRKFMAL